MTVITFFFLAESHGPTLLAAKLKKIRKETGNQNFVAKENGVADAKTVFLRAILRPSRMLLRSPIVTGLSMYLAVIYAYAYLLFTTFSTVFSGQYGFDTGVLGLAFLGLGFGMMIALYVLGSFSDKIQARLAARHGESKLE
jgi:amino acid transporter